MAKSTKDNSDWTSLPVLTEVVGDVPPEVPLLTEEALHERKLALDSGTPELSADQIAALLAPRLEKQLRAEMSAQFELLWQETWRQARTQLPDLIRDQLAAQPANTRSTASKMPELGIIAPRSPAPAAKKPAAGRVSAAKGTKAK